MDTGYLQLYRNLPVFQCLKQQLVVSNPLPIASPNLRLQFPTQVFLRNRNILFIEVFTATDMPAAPNGNVLPTGANLKQCFLTLYSNDPEYPTASGEYMQVIPMLTLHRINNFTDPYVFQVNSIIPRMIVWEKSYIDFQPVTGNLTYGNTSIMNHVLNVYYTGLDDPSSAT